MDGPDRLKGGADADVVHDAAVGHPHPADLLAADLPNAPAVAAAGSVALQKIARAAAVVRPEEINSAGGRRPPGFAAVKENARWILDETGSLFAGVIKMPFDYFADDHIRFHLLDDVGFKTARPPETTDRFEMITQKWLQVGAKGIAKDLSLIHI